MVLNAEFSGDYSVKFRVFGRTLWQTSNHLQASHTFDVKLDTTVPIDLPGPLDLFLTIGGKTVTVGAVFNGFPVYSEQFDVSTLVAKDGVRVIPLKGFDERGVKLSNATLKLSF